MPFNPNFKTLPKKQRRAWSQLGPAKDMGFCLYGGTALALRFGHRESVDFDFFSAEALDKSLLMAKLPLLQGAVTLQEAQNSYVALVAPAATTDTVKISFFGGMSFGRVGIPELSADGVLLAASVRDLMATKLKVVFDRIEPRDYLDIAEMLARGISLSEGICDALALFPTFSPIHCLKTLCFFAPKELAGLDRKCKSVLTKAVESVYSTSQTFIASPTVSSTLVLPANDMAAELNRVRAAPPSTSHYRPG